MGHKVCGFHSRILGRVWSQRGRDLNRFTLQALGWVLVLSKELGVRTCAKWGRHSLSLSLSFLILG